MKNAPAPDPVPGPTSRELFRFTSFQQWVNKARSWFENCGHDTAQTICIDAKGRACRIGGHFMRARDEGAFPVVVYLIDGVSES